MANAVIVPGQVSVDITWLDDPSYKGADIVGACAVGLPGGKVLLVGGMTRRLAVAASMLGGKHPSALMSPMSGSDEIDGILKCADILIAEEKRQREQE